MPPADSSAALRVTTLPSGLPVLVDGEPVGRSPLLLSSRSPGRVKVRVFREDPRQFDRAADEMWVTLEPADTALAAFDLRPPVVLETRPSGAGAFLRPDRGDALLIGRTPVPLSPAEYPGRLFLFRHPCCADTTVAGDALLAQAGLRGTALVELRRVVPLAVPPVGGKTRWNRRWLQWGLMGVGAGLTVAARLWKREADRWYDRYLESSDRRVLEGYYDRAVLYDRRSVAALVSGQVLFTGGLVLLVSQRSP